MQNLLRLLLVLGLAGSALTFAGSATAWWFDEERRLRRLIHRSLGGDLDAIIVARGRNAGAGFRLASGQLVVMRDGGANALLYPLQALIGAELMVDGQVVARAVRDEPRRALDQVAGAASRVSLRLLFDDPRHPDFLLDLWLPEDEARRDVRPPSDAIEEARGWLARAEAILRRGARVTARATTAVEDDDEAEETAESPENDLF
ncbi:MAG TPA: hypothetical protein VHY32_01210 [Caulobacteraceae bacterium]|nr:hypothetical protein [Caulobacteraceae bacterium]